MQTLIHYYWACSWLVFCVPVIIPVGVGVVAARMPRYKWGAHVATYVALIAAYPLYVKIGNQLDPTSIGNPGLGLGLMLYGYVLLPALLLYSIFAWFIRTKPDRARRAA
jgi:hypothetical protein